MINLMTLYQIYNMYIMKHKSFLTRNLATFSSPQLHVRT
jgi:hypothetical protein